MRTLRLALLALWFLFAFQIFYYAIDIFPLYVLSKILLPASALFISYLLALGFLLRGSAYPHSIFLSGIFLFLVPLSALMSYINFSQPFLQGVAAQIKLMPIFFYFLSLTVFKKLHVGGKDLTYSLIILGIVSLSVYYSVHLFFDMFRWSSDESRVVIYDTVRGYRLNLPVVFIVILIFYLYRRFIEERRLIYVLFLAPAIFYLVVFWKQRFELLGIFLTLLLISAKAFTRRPVTVMMFVSLAGSILFSFLRIDYFHGEILSHSVILRMGTIETIIHVLSENWMNVLFGVGNLLGTEDLNFRSLYGSNFWPSDVGWLGIIFEFGITGTLLFAYIYILLIRNSYRYAADETPAIIMALRDYVYMTILISPLIPSLPYLMGVYTTTLAIFVYYNHNVCVLEGEIA
ncbi:MAG: hypothetical protein AABZ10_03010 [Nitrospirota bacterium]